MGTWGLGIRVAVLVLVVVAAFNLPRDWVYPATERLPTTETTDDVRVLRLLAGDYSLTPTEVWAEPGDRIRLIVTNTGAQTHRIGVERIWAPDVRLIELPGSAWGPYLEPLLDQAARGIPEVLVSPGSRAVVEFTAVAPGSYPITCQLPDHADVGMVSVLTIGAGLVAHPPLG